MQNKYKITRYRGEAVKRMLEELSFDCALEESDRGEFPGAEGMEFWASDIEITKVGKWKPVAGQGNIRWALLTKGSVPDLT